MTSSETCRRKVRRLVAVTVVFIAVCGCAAIRPYEPRNHREEGPEKGIFTGTTGEFVIYRKVEAPPEEDTEEKKSSGNNDSGTQPAAESGQNKDHVVPSGSTQ